MSLSETGWRHAVSEPNRARVGYRRIGRADDFCRRHSIAKANSARIRDFLGGLTYDRLFLLLGHDVLLGRVDRSLMDCAPGDAVGRSKFTQETTRFINPDRIGKNERFAYTLYAPGETPGLR